MLKRLSTEVKLTDEQKKQLKLELAAKLFVRNLYIQEQNKSEDYINNYEFSKWFNNVYIPENPDMQWLKRASSKNIRNVMDVVHKTYQNAFKGMCGFPVKKKHKEYNASYYFVRQNKQCPISLERHKIKVPCLGWVTLKEEGYIHGDVISGTIKQRGDRYFISAVVNVNECYANFKDGEGLGIDFGIKDFLILSNGIIFPNINKSPLIRKLEKKLKREQRALSRKFESLKKKPKEERTYKNIEKK